MHTSKMLTFNVPFVRIKRLNDKMLSKKSNKKKKKSGSEIIKNSLNPDFLCKSQMPIVLLERFDRNLKSTMFTGNENVRSILREHSPGDPKCDFRQKKTEKNFQDDNDPEFVEKLHLNDQNFQSESNLSQCYIKVVNRTVDDSALFEPLCTKLSSSILNISITEQTKSDISQDSVLNMANTIPKMIIDLDNEEQRQNISIIKNSELDKSVSLNDMPQNNEMMAALVDGLDDQNLQSSEVVHNIVNNTNYNLQSNGQITIDCTSDMNDIKTDQVLDNSSLCDALFNPSINPNIQVENQDIKIKYKSDKEVDNLNKVLQPNENNFDRIFQKEFNFEVNNNYLSAQFTSPEDELIDAVIIPIIDEANYDDSDLSQYNSNYEISDQLESILSSQLNSETVEIIRDSSINVIDDNQNLSIPQLEHHPNEYNSDNINSVLSGYNVTDKNSSDVDYDPKKITHSSTMADDSTEITGLPATFNNKSIGFEDKLTNSSPCASSTQNIIISNSSSIKIPLPSKGSCDNSKLNAESIFITNKETGDVLHKPRWKKKYFCIYCHKLVIKLPRHIETVHKDLEEAQQLKNTPKGTKERKKLIEIYRDNGRAMHNTHPDYNTGLLLVSRRPKLDNKPANDYTTCPKCLKTVTKANSYKHYAVCINAKTNGSQSYKFLGRYVEGRIHATASDTLSLVIFPVFHEDVIVRLIRYDWLVILYGNKLCIKYTPHYQHNMIRARLRLVGRLLFAAKQINSQVEDLASLLAPEYIDTIVKAIEIVARINRMENNCGAPSSALNLVTYLKHIRKIYESELAKKNDKDGLDRVIRFKKVYKNEVPDSINKIAMEGQSKIKRQKIVMLPMTEDIGRLIYYLKTERKRCFKILEKSFNLLEWLNGLKLVSAFLLVFNRRRVGDIQNILISDFSRIECIDKKKDLEEFNLLDESGKKIAQKFFRVAIRGKKNRTVAVIAGGDIIKEIGLLIRHRISANVPPRNEYLFGLPNNVDDRIRVVNICKEMRLYSVACGAEKPELLRGTGLRKHVATKCMELELNDKALGDVMNHMGHSEKIHRDFYQQPTKSKTIVQVAKVLEAVQGPIDDDEEEGDDDLIDDVSDYIVISDKVNEDDLDENPRESSAYSPKPGCLHEIKAIGDDKNIIDSQLSPIRNMEFDENSELSNSPVVRMTADFKVGKKNGQLTPGKVQRKRWTSNELNIVSSAFRQYLHAGTLPPLNEIDDLQEKYPCLQNRSRQSIKTWVSNQFKSQIKSTTKLKVINNQPVKFNLTKIVQKDNNNAPQVA